MRCPHCADSFTPKWAEQNLGKDPDATGIWFVQWTNCPTCYRVVARMLDYDAKGGAVQEKAHLVHPAIPTRVVPDEVEEPYASDFREAATTLHVSAKASAALSRRLLQHLLREKAGVKHSNLMAEIDEIRDMKILPVGLADDLHGIRHVGNFAAHPIKDTETETVADVEEGEADWLLELLDELLDFFFVAPAKRAERREALNRKLEAVGKPPLDEA